VHIAERPLKIAKVRTEGGAAAPARAKKTARGAKKAAASA